MIARKITRFIKRLRRELLLVMLNLGHPRFIRRELARRRNHEAMVANIKARMGQLNIAKAKEVMAQYDDMLDKVRKSEIIAQLKPGELGVDELAALKSSRQKLNSHVLLVEEQKKHIAFVEKGLREIEGLEKDVRLLTRRYKRIVFYWNVILTLFAFQIASMVKRSGVVPGFVVYVASGGLVARGTGVFVALLLGGGLYWLRNRWRRLYAALELGSALLAAWSSLGDSRLLDDTAKQVSLIGAIYLIVRAFDNFAQGQKAIDEIHKRRVSMAALRLTQRTVELKEG